MLFKRLTQLLFVTLCVLPFAPFAHTATAAPKAKVEAPACAPGASAADITALTAEERQAFQLAQQQADPQLGEQRGGFLGLVIVILLIILIVVIVD